MFPLYSESRKKNKIAIITISLIIINTVVFFYTYQDLNFYINFYGFRAENFFDGKLYTVFSSMFLHGDILHLLGNMWFLWVFGDDLESRMGNFKFLLFYFFCGICSAALYAITSLGTGDPVVGASGAISGILGGYLMIFPKNKIKAIIPIPVLFIASLPAFIFIIAWFIFQMVSVGGESIVAYWGHIGGFLAGALFIKRFRKKFF
jgi:membrane associated rhomboid family serine protease